MTLCDRARREQELGGEGLRQSLQGGMERWARAESIWFCRATPPVTAKVRIIS